MDYFAGILELIALWLLGLHNKVGFLIGLLGNIAWITYVFMSSSTYGLLLICSVAAIINIRNFIKWSK